MRVRIRHTIAYAFDPPARSIIQTLRLTPRSNECQRVLDWGIDVNQNCRLAESEDAFANVTHTFSLDGPIAGFSIVVDGEVETFDSAGVVRGAREKFLSDVYLRDTPLTEADAAMCDFAQVSTAKGTSLLDRLHMLMEATYERLVFDAEAATKAQTASEAFSQSRGGPGDFAHVFIACARHLEIPARYVSGYFLGDEDAPVEGVAHGWAEAFVDGLGWVAFDSVKNICPQERHIRVACGLDYLGAAPIRSWKATGGEETIDASVKILHGQMQSQSQSQS